MDNYLYHHGILGQKWGVRRYRKKDGTLTSAGKRRYQKEQYKQDYTQLTNQELKKRIARAELERKYSDITKKDIRNGKETATYVLATIGSIAATAYTTTKIIDWVSKRKG